jgi:hypothetical protein
MGPFESARRPVTDPADRVLTLSLPSPPPKKKINNPPKKCLPIKLPHHQCSVPGIDPIVKPPSVNPVNRTHAKDSHPKPASDHALTPSRTRLSIPLVTVREQQPWCTPTRMWLTLSENPAKNHQEPDSSKQARVSIPPPNSTRSRTRAVSRTNHSLDQVRGLTSTPIPPPFHRLGETCSQTSLPRAIVFFLSSFFGGIDWLDYWVLGLDYQIIW